MLITLDVRGRLVSSVSLRRQCHFKLSFPLKVSAAPCSANDTALDTFAGELLQKSVFTNKSAQYGQKCSYFYQKSINITFW